MAENTQNQNQNAAMLRNIIVGVTTSVIGAGVLFLLGINKGGQSTTPQTSFLEVKEATVKGWKSYMSIDNIANKNIQSISADFKRDLQLDNFKENYLKEVHKFEADVESILKDETMDNSFISMLKRRLDVEKDSESKLSTYIDNLKSILADNTMSTGDKQQRLAKEDQRFTNMAKGVIERDITEVEGLAKVLNDKYGPVFDLNESISYKEYKSGKFNTNGNPTDYTTSTTNPQQDNNVKPVSSIPVQPQTSQNDQYSAANNQNANQNASKEMNAGMFAGDWDNEGGTLHLDNKGFVWNWNDAKEASQGGWYTPDMKKIYFTIQKGYNQGYSWTFIISDLTPTSFNMQLENYNQYTYHLTKQ